MTNVKMNAGKITAKLRDAVPVRFMVDDAEVIQYKNIDIPDALKELEITGFQFDVPEDGKISFQLFFAAGVLPEEFPEARAKMTREEKRAAKTIHTSELADAVADTIKAAGGTDVIVNIGAAVNADEASQIEVAYNVTGDQRKELVTAIGEIIGAEPIYKKPPTYAYEIGNYRVDRNGTLTGESNPELITALAERGFVAA